VTQLRLTSAARDEYVDFCEGIRRLAQVDLLQYKRTQMERRIRSFAHRRGVEALAEYLRLLERERDELDSFLDRMTINVSQLWRNPQQWELLARTVVPELARTGQIRAWSAGSSYGAEAYTLVAVLRDTAPGCRVDVLGTDIDQRMVERARAGLFSDEEARHADRRALERWFERVDDGWKARRELKRSTRFEVGDLLRMKPPKAAYDLVLCRNVVIYFTEEVRDELHARLAASLRPGGYLLIGSTERVTRPANMGLTVACPFVYRKA
jgi:chemotaxis protein methyltransferase CheR